MEVIQYCYKQIVKAFFKAIYTQINKRRYKLGGGGEGRKYLRKSKNYKDQGRKGVDGNILAILGKRRIDKP